LLTGKATVSQTCLLAEDPLAVDMNNTATDSACVTQFLLGMNISLAANNKIYVCELYQLIIQALATYGTRAKRGTWNDFQWHAE